MAVGGFELFRLFGSIGLKGGDDVNKQLDGVQKKSGGVGKFFKGVAKGALVAGAAATTFAVVVGTKAVKAASDWETGLANINTLLGGDDPLRLGVISDAMKNLSKETGLSAESVQEGAYQVISAFGDSEETADLLEIMAKAAVAGNVSVADSLNLVSGVTKGYGDTSKEAAQKASDLAFMTTVLGQTTFPELAASMGGVVPFASALNVKQEELFGTMATLTGVTGNTAEVGTQLEGVFKGLMKPSKDMEAALKKMGYESGAAAFEALGFQGTLEGLKDAVDDDEIALGNLWGEAKSGNAVMVLTGAQADNLTKKTLAMNEAVGATETAYEKQSKTFANSMARMKQKLNVALVDIGTKLLPIVEKLMDAFMELVPPLMEFITPLIDKLMPVVQTIISKLFPVFLELLDAFMPILDPLIDIFIFLIEDALIPLMDILVPIIKQIMPIFVKLLDMLIPILEPLLKLFFTLVEAILPPLMDLVLKLIEAFMPLINAVLPIIVELLEIMMPIWLLWIDALVWMVDKVLPLVIAYWKWIAEKVFPAVLAVLKKIRPVIENIVKWFRDLPAKIPGIMEDLKNKIAAVWAKIKWATEKVFIQIRGGILTKFYNIRDGIKNIGKSIKDTAVGIFESISSGIKSKIDKARSFVYSAIQKIKGYFKFSWKLPKLKMPHFSLRGKFSLTKMTVPKLRVSWWEKGGILTKPTIFGRNGKDLMAGGEKGPEAVAPISTLQKYVAQAVMSAGGKQPTMIVNINDPKIFNMDDVRKMGNALNMYWQASGVGKAR